ncbi:hypothetical protein LCGC14_3135290, partial [marine sediment metagenome]
MAKRYTSSTKWQDPWFRRLPPKMKLFWLFILDACDAAGVWLVDLEQAAFSIGESYSEDEIREVFFECERPRLEELDSEKWWVLGFIAYQYRTLSRDCKGQKYIWESIDNNNLLGRLPDTLSDRLPGRVRGSHKDKDKYLHTGSRVASLSSKGGTASKGRAKTEGNVDLAEVLVRWQELGKNPKDNTGTKDRTHRSIVRHLEKHGLEKVLLAVDRLHQDNDDLAYLHHIANAFGQHAEIAPYYAEDWKPAKSGKIPPPARPRKANAEPKPEPLAPIPKDLDRDRAPWEAALVVLAEEIDEENFETWIKPLVYLG